jgi:hypothetical protein
MFGLFGHKTKRKVMKLERIMMAMEAAAKANDLRTLHRYTREQLVVLQWLNEHGDWSEEQLFSFLRKRGLVRSFVDPAVQELLSQKVPESEMMFGLASTGLGL